MENDKLKQMIEDEVRKQLSGSLFTARKLGDTPTDNLQLVPRSYITRYCTTANRPTTHVLHEQIYDTNLLTPIWWSGSDWRNGAGAIV